MRHRSCGSATDRRRMEARNGRVSAQEGSLASEMEVAVADWTHAAWLPQLRFAAGVDAAGVAVRLRRAGGTAGDWLARPRVDLCIERGRSIVYGDGLRKRRNAAAAAHTSHNL